MKITPIPKSVTPLVFAACVGLAVFTAVPAAFAQNTTWTGNASTSDWNTAGNWDDGVPVGVGGASATIAADGANVTMSAAGNSRLLVVAGNGATAPVLNITQNLTNNFSRVQVGSNSGSADGHGGTVNHTAGTFLIGGGSGNRDLHIAAWATATTTGNTGTYNFGGASATAPVLDILVNLNMGNRPGESALLSLSGYGEVKVGNELGMSRANGTSEIRIEGGNLDISVANDMIIRGGGAGFATIRGVIDNTGFSTINVGGNVFFHPTNTNRATFALELGAGYTHVLNTVYTIIDAEGLFQFRDGTTITSGGRFGNVANNDILTVGGYDFRANYVTNDGTQFTLTAIPEPSTVGLVFISFVSVIIFRRWKGLN
jgi:hypothetical protein